MSEFFTSQTKIDQRVILDTCQAATRNGKLRFLEIGVFYGSTAKGIKQACDTSGVELEYFGVDDFSHPNFTGKEKMPLDFGVIAMGASWDVFWKLPNEMDIVFVDGNHSGNAVILDTALYAPKVRKGGYMMFHDTALQVQQTMPEQNAPDHPWWSNSVNAAHELISWPWNGWKMVSGEYDKEASFGGIRVYQKQ